MEKFYGTIRHLRILVLFLRNFSISFLNMFKLIHLLAQEIYTCTEILRFLFGIIAIYFSIE